MSIEVGATARLWASLRPGGAVTSVAPPAVLHRRLAPMMRSAQRLEIGGLVAATHDLRDDVVDVSGGAAARWCVRSPPMEPDGHSTTVEAGTARRRLPRTGATTSRNLEREYITSQMSLRELCRRHGISAHSLVSVQAKQGKWAQKREAYRARESATYIPRHADNMPAREAEVRDHALDAIDEAITKFRSDMQRTQKKLICGEWIEVPVILITPRDVALLIDKFQILFDRPSIISEGRGVSITSESLPVEALQEFIERTRGLAEPVPQDSPIPRRPRRLDD